jgi:hypothetical protein
MSGITLSPQFVGGATFTPSCRIVFLVIILASLFEDCLSCLVEGVCWIQLALRTRLDYISRGLSVYVFIVFLNRTSVVDSQH